MNHFSHNLIIYTIDLMFLLIELLNFHYLFTFFVSHTACTVYRDYFGLRVLVQHFFRTVKLSVEIIKVCYPQVNARAK